MSHIQCYTFQFRNRIIHSFFLFTATFFKYPILIHNFSLCSQCFLLNLNVIVIFLLILFIVLWFSHHWDVIFILVVGFIILVWSRYFMGGFSIRLIRLSGKLINMVRLGWICLLILSCLWDCCISFRMRSEFMSLFGIFSSHFSFFGRNSNRLKEFLTTSLLHQIFRKYFEYMYQWPLRLRKFYKVDFHFQFEITIHSPHLIIIVIHEWKETFDWDDCGF